MVFTYVPDWGGRIHPYLFSNASDAFSTYVYFHFEHLVFIILGWIIVSDSKYTERWTNTVFFGVLLFDYIDWILTANNAWGGTFVTGNIVKLLAFGFLTWRTDNEP